MLFIHSLSSVIHDAPKKTSAKYLQQTAQESVTQKKVFTYAELTTLLNLRDEKNITFPAYLFMAGYSLPTQTIAALDKVHKDCLPLPMQIAKLSYFHSLAEIKELCFWGDRWAAEGILKDQLINHSVYPSKEDFMALGSEWSKFGENITHHLAQKASLAYFSVDDIITLGDRVGIRLSLSHILAQRGRLFTVEEIEKLKNPADEYGATLAHRVASQHKDAFQISDLLKPIFQQKIFFDHLVFYSGSTGGNYSVCDCDMYNDKFWLTHQGATVAHIMAREGHQFSPEEIRLLGDPVDAYGLSLSSWQNEPAACIAKIEQLYQDHRL